MYLNDIVSFFHHKTTEENLRGGKHVYVEWLQELKKNDVLFVFKGEGFGLGWVVNKILASPPTRVPSIRDREDFLLLLKSTY